MNKKNLMRTIPNWKDPRWLFLLVAFSYVTHFAMLSGSGRTLELFFAIALGCAFLDLILHRLRNGIWLFPLSGFIAGFGIFFACDVASPWYYAILCTLAIGSKHFLQLGGRHIFNPSNFAIVVGGVALTNSIGGVGTLRWDGNVIHTLIMFILCSIVIIRANRWAVVVGYLFTGLIYGTLHFTVLRENGHYFAQRMLWEGIMIFIFFMLTDPKTTPNQLWAQTLFGSLAGILYWPFLALHVRVPEQIGLFLTTLVLALLDRFVVKGALKNNPWQKPEVSHAQVTA